MLKHNWACLCINLRRGHDCTYVYIHTRAGIIWLRCVHMYAWTRSCLCVHTYKRYNMIALMCTCIYMLAACADVYIHARVGMIAPMGAYMCRDDCTYVCIYVQA